MALPLGSVTVLVMPQIVAGPFGCMLRAMGADVAAVEPREAGDATRHSFDFRRKGSENLEFLPLNRSQRSNSLDLKSDERRKVLNAPTKTTNVLAEYARPASWGEKCNVRQQSWGTV